MFQAGITQNAGIELITSGLTATWFVETGASTIGRITPAGVVTEFSAGISAGAWHHSRAMEIWFTEAEALLDDHWLGVVTEFSDGITVGAVPPESPPARWRTLIHVSG
jgi:antibiotic biosynthesis monooxygenase (ABM) superfamily enzyme